MPGRTRTSAFSRSGGGTRRRSLNGSIVVNDVQGPLQVYESVCDDVVNNWDGDNGLLIQRKDNDVQPLNGLRTVSFDTWKEYRNWYPTYASSSTGHLAYSLPSSGSVATSTLAQSNPSKPYVSVPNFLYELKDLPGMIRDIGRLKLYARRYYYSRTAGTGQRALTARDTANHQLSYQMGWSPLISDIRKLLDFQAKVDRKIHDLNRLFNEHKGLHRTIRPKSGIWKTVLSSESNVAIESGMSDIVRCDVLTVTTAEIWGSVRWTSNSPPGTTWSDAKLARTARNLTFGLNINPKAVWDAIPWTWLIGWFSNVDEYLQAHTNVIPVFHSTPCVMLSLETVATYTRKDTYEGTYHGGYGTKTQVRKSRNLDSGTLSASVPFLSARQLSILGALAIQRRR